MKYTIFCPNNLYPIPSELILRNNIFNYWKNFWSEIYSSAGSIESFKTDDFFRQKQICVITDKDQIVAVHLYTYFNLNCHIAKNHSYFNFYNDEFLSIISSKNISTVMSMEFMTLNSNYRKSKTKIPYALILAYLGALNFNLSGVDAIIAPARKDVGVHKMSYLLGFDCIQKDVMQRNFMCDMVALKKGNLIFPEDLNIREEVEKLWMNRTDYTSIAESQSNLRLIA
jgi:hypothetical protein